MVRYPRGLRARFGADMIRFFSDEVDTVIKESGVRGLGALWGRVLREALRPLPGPVGGPHDSPPRRGLSAPDVDGRSTGRWERLLEDLGFAGRSLRREPRFTVGIVLVLGAGMALNTSVFAVVNAYLLRPLPYPDADRVVSVQSPVGVTWEDARDILEKRVSWDLDAFTLLGGSGPELALGAWVTTDFLEVYGVEPVLGRIFREDEGGAGAESVAVISHGLWQRRYGGDPRVLGRTFAAFTSDRPDDAETFTIVGVLPRDFWHFNRYTEVLAPLREDWNLYAGRLRMDVPLAAAERLLTDRVLDRIVGAPEGFAVRLERAQDAHVGMIRPTLWTLQAAALLVLLIVVANGAVLLLVRASRREREFAVRRALGASGGRLGRQLVSEGMLIAGLAGAVALGLSFMAVEAVGGLEALSNWRSVPGGAASLRLDPTVWLVSMALVLGTGAVFGMIPVVSSARNQIGSALAAGGRAGTDTRGRRRARTAIVAGELALSLALLTGAGLLVQSAINLQAAELGFDPEGVVRGQAGLRQATYPEAGARVDFFEALEDRVSELPAVESVGLAGTVPFTWRFSPRRLESQEGTIGEGVVQVADGAYFDAMRIRTGRGRTFTRGDVAGAERVVVVSSAVASRLWPASDALGRRLRVSEVGVDADPPGPWATVIGVVDDVRKAVDDADSGDVYFAHSQSEASWMNVVIRRVAGAPSPVPAIEVILAAMDPTVPFSTVESLDDLVGAATAPSRFLAMLFGGFASFALLLAVLGLYAVMSYAAAQSRRDVAVRMALGAHAPALRGLFLRQTGVIVAVGLGLGAYGSWLLGEALESQLHGIGPHDVVTLVSVGLVLVLSAFAASWVPARRATNVEPMSVLRED